jgi:anthranilate synthase/aminodeoxychorismate synthase-like glutamine amidotransferase
VRELWRELPILGVCLGHQAIAQALGANIVRAPQPLHGRTSEVLHNEQGIFAGVANPLVACRYHSLVIEEATLPPELEVTARTADGIVMAIAHRTFPLVGVQFHPEAILTQCGYALLANFLRLAGIAVTDVLPGDELPRRMENPPALPGVPITF